MKKLLTTLAILLLSTSALASPFLVSDFQAADGIDYYEIQIDGGAWIQSAPEPSTGGTMVRVRFNLAPLNLPNGMHTYVARACNAVWGCSADSVPLDSLKIIPETPSGVDLEK